MEKSKIAEKEIEVAKWLQKQGYDRRVYKEVAPIIIDYLTEFKLLDLHFVSNNEERVSVCRHCCGLGEIQRTTDIRYTCPKCCGTGQTDC